MPLQHHVNGGDQRDCGKNEKEENIHLYAPTQDCSATRNPVIRRFSNATGNRPFHAKPISWSYRKRGSVARIQTKTKSRKPHFARNQKSGIRTGTRNGTSITPASAKNMTPNAGSVYLSSGRAGLIP